MTVLSQKANMGLFVSYIMLFQLSLVYNIPAVVEEDLLAYCDLMSFNFHYNILFILILTSFFSSLDIILMLK